MHSIIQRLCDDFGYVPVTAAEIEFYLPDSETRDLTAYWQDVSRACEQAGISIFRIEKERGIGQHEISLTPASPEKTARDILFLKNLLKEADFSAKPFADQPGSGLHIHVHLEDATGKNIFYKDDAIICDALKFSLGGLLARMRDDMPIFAPHPDSLKRFTPGSNGPLTVSWGANNRTTALRLPDSDRDKKRIEHRVAGSDADPEKVISAILAGIYYGLENRCDPGQQIYGDASLAMYGLPQLVTPA